MCEDEFIRIFGIDRVIGCVVGWGANYHKDKSYEMTSRGEFVIGAFSEKAGEKLEMIRDILNSVLPAEINENIRGYLYSKLIINSAITSLGLISGLRLGVMLTKRNMRNHFINIMREAIQVAMAMGIKVEPYAGKLDYYEFIDDSLPLAGLKRHITMLFIGFKYRRLRSSALQSLERGRPTEILWLNGYITSNAQKYNISVPVNAGIVKIAAEIEAGQLKPSMETIKMI